MASDAKQKAAAFKAVRDAVNSAPISSGGLAAKIHAFNEVAYNTDLPELLLAAVEENERLKAGLFAAPKQKRHIVENSVFIKCN